MLIVEWLCTLHKYLRNGRYQRMREGEETFPMLRVVLISRIKRIKRHVNDK